MTNSDLTHDVVIVGAGLSGICAAHYLQVVDGIKYVILERRANSGGTWDLHRYAGIRSDSDMFTFSLPWKPWPKNKSLGSGGEILEYLREASVESGADKHMLFNRKVTCAAWSDADKFWRISVTKEEPKQEEEGEEKEGKQENKKKKEEGEEGEKKEEYRARYYFNCAGYYSYDHPEMPTWKGQEEFTKAGGILKHAQFFTDKDDFEDKKVVIIGSGATAVSIFPALQPKVKKVTILQRSPGYLINISNSGSWLTAPILWLKWILPLWLVVAMMRWVMILLTVIYFNLFRAFPKAARWLLIYQVKALLGKKGTPEMMKNFSPTYFPWDQRLAAIPDADLIRAIRDKKENADIVTDSIKEFDSKGIVLNSGNRLDADIIISATGLRLQARGGATITVNGVAQLPSEQFLYRGCMASDIPNFFSVMGYFNSSWTQKAAMITEYAARIIKHMREKKYSVVTPKATAEEKNHKKSISDMTSGYLQRGKLEMPVQGESAPWRMSQNVLYDCWLIWWAPMEDPSHLFYTKEESKKEK